MKTRLFFLTVMLCAFSAIASSQIDGEDEDAVSFGDIPMLVRDVILERAKGAKIEECSKDIEDGVVTFDAAWIVDRKKHEVEVAEDGVVVASSKEVAVESVPSRIRKKIQAHFPIGAKIEFEAKNVIIYEAAAEFDGKEIEVLITASGQIVEESDD